MVSASVSASLNAAFDGFGFGFGFVMIFSSGFVFGFSECCVWLPKFNRRFDKTFIYKLCFDFYLPAGDPFRLHPLFTPDAFLVAA